MNRSSVIGTQSAHHNLDPWFTKRLACPVDRSPLTLVSGGRLVCHLKHSFPVIEGVPVLLNPLAEQTIHVAQQSIDNAERASKNCSSDDPYYLQSIGVSESERLLVERLIEQGSDSVDPVVSVLIAATNGYMYKHLIGKLETYPIPDIRLPNSDGASLLDVGCNWGRWTLAAAKKGYTAVGIDPSLGAIMAAKRVARHLGVPALFLVADARYLPFHDQVFQTAFSYSVLQHFSKEDANLALEEIGRILSPGGDALVQMPNRLGPRCLYHQLRRGFREATGFEVRYWTLRELVGAFKTKIGTPQISIDCFFGIGIQECDYRLMPRSLKLVTFCSKILRLLGRKLTWLTHFADSVYVSAKK